MLRYTRPGRAWPASRLPLLLIIPFINLTDCTMLSNYRPGVLSFAGFVAALLICFSSCSKDTVHPPPDVAVDEGPVKGFFLLNEANMGSYKSSIDYYDYTSGDYLKNIYPQRNPTITQS